MLAAEPDRQDGSAVIEFRTRVLNSGHARLPPAQVTGVPHRPHKVQRFSIGDREPLASAPVRLFPTAWMWLRRPHRALHHVALLKPLPPPASQPDLRLRHRDRLGGLIHEYARAA